VVAGAEGAITGARDDAHPRVGVGGEVVEDLDELGVGVCVERVQALRPVEGHVGDVALLLVDDVVVRHGRGRNFATATSSLMRSKVTTSGMPMARRSLAQPTTWLVRRTPSSVSTTAMLYGMSAAKASS